MVTKTRDRLIEVARYLFAHKGIENTTMNDIATASEKGRRTIYTYFKNKRDIYNAVVERESDQILLKLTEIASSDATPVEKLHNFLEARFDLFANAFHRRDTFRALFGRDFRRMEKIHKLLFTREHELLRSILDEGVAQGVFNPALAPMIPALLTMTYEGVDYSHFRNNFKDTGMTPDKIKLDIVSYLTQTLVTENRQ